MSTETSVSGMGKGMKRVRNPEKARQKNRILLGG